MRKLESYVLLLSLVLLFSAVPWKAYGSDSTYTFKVYFLQQESTFDPAFRENLRIVDEALGRLRADKCKISGVELTGYCSLEGKVGENEVLGLERAKDVSSFLQKHSPDLFPDGETFKVISGGEAWFVVRDMIAASGDDYSGDICNIINTTPVWVKKDGVIVGGRKKNVMNYRSGKVWWDLEKKYFEDLRFVEVVVSYSVPESVAPSDSEVAGDSPETVESVPVTVEEFAEETSTDSSAFEPVSKAELYESLLGPSVGEAEPVDTVCTEDTPVSEENPSGQFSIGTNLLYDAAAVANLHFQIGFAKRLALNVMGTYSPWDFMPGHKFRTLLIQPEFRVYFAPGFKKHYLGVEGHYGWYNIAIPDSRTRYQDKDGNTPLWGAGLSYGYVLPFGEHWGMDFGISAGYAHLVYDCFYNTENGAKFTTQSKDWWGPTKAGISIYYRF